MKTVSHPLFLSVFSIYFVYYLLKIFSVQMPEIATSYLADLLSLFIVNTIILWFLRLIKSNKKLELKTAKVIVSFVLFSVFFEFYLPAVKDYYQKDYWDILCYAISAFGFLLWRRKQSLIK